MRRTGLGDVGILKIVCPELLLIKITKVENRIGA